MPKTPKRIPRPALRNENELRKLVEEAVVKIPMYRLAPLARKHLIDAIMDDAYRQQEEFKVTEREELYGN